jgi:hypothetical protein
MLKTFALGERHMARTPAGTAARYVAELTSAALAEHQPAWWLMPVN